MLNIYIHILRDFDSNECAHIFPVWLALSFRSTLQEPSRTHSDPTEFCHPDLEMFTENFFLDSTTFHRTWIFHDICFMRNCVGLATHVWKKKPAQELPSTISQHNAEVAELLQVLDPAECSYHAAKILADHLKPWYLRKIPTFWFQDW